MKNLKQWTLRITLGCGILGLLLSADHIDAPSSMGTTADIADFFAYEPTEDSDNTVFVANLQTDVLPELAYGSFDENVLIEFNIDNDGDLVEDLVIQAIPRNGRMFFFGPVEPSTTGTESMVYTDAPLGSVLISGPEASVETTLNGVSLFAGPRQDPFFFDFFQYNKVISGQAPEGFKPAGEAEDTFQGANTMAVVIEIPNVLLGETTATNALGLPVYKTWITTNIKQ